MHRPLRHRRPRGQVLAYVVVIMVALLMVTIFLFDLQGLVRVRGKTQNGVDSAALVGANWQGRSLNMIGELNLLKASTYLVSDIPPLGDASATGLAEADLVLSEMQTRVAYVGPMIGFMAMQQAARNNGLRNVDEFTDRYNAHITDSFGATGLFNSYDPVYMNYNWFEGYESLLRRAAGDGITAHPTNSRYLSGQPRLTGPGAELLSDPSFYSAVHNRYYCWFYRRGYGPDYDASGFGSTTLTFNDSDFFVGSEFLPLYVRFEQQEPDYDAMNTFLADRGQTPHAPGQPGLDQIHFAVYEDSTGEAAGWADTSMYGEFNARNYLRGDVKPEYVYGGAAARIECRSQPSIITGNWKWNLGETQEQPTSLGDELAWSEENMGGGHTFGEQGRRLAGAEAALTDLRSRETVVSSAAAKPFGRLDVGVPPHDSGMVLPVFTDVRLIPAALVQKTGIDAVGPEFYRFLLEYFGDPNYPNVPQDVRDRYWYYITAIEEFQDMGSDFRIGWWDFDAWRLQYMAGADGIPGTADDVRDPCLPPPQPPYVPPGGGGGGGGHHGGSSTGGPTVLH